MKTLLTLESSGVLRDLLVKWSEAVAARRAANAAYFAREIRVGAGVVLASPTVLETYLRRAGLPITLQAHHVAKIVSEFFITTTLAMFPETAPALEPTPATEPQPPGAGRSGPH